MFERFFKTFKRDAGTDIIADKTIVLHSGMNVIELNLNVCPPKNHCAIVVPRSSLALQGIFIANCPIDSDYKGRIKAIVFNSVNEDIVVRKGERFCQFVILKCIPNLYKIKPAKKGRRKYDGWGSSGKC